MLLNLCSLSGSLDSLVKLLLIDALVGYLSERAIP